MSRSKTFAIVLVMMLLFAQGLGLLHEIAHAGWHHHGRVQLALDSGAQSLDAGVSGGAQRSVLSAEDARDLALFGHVEDNGHGDRHACAEFDAAAIGNGIHIKFPLLIAIPSTHVLTLWHAFISWDAPVLTCFSSRAPPA